MPVYDVWDKLKDIHMKTMTCSQLGGACEKEFQADSFEEMAELSKKHSMEMFEQQDEAHLSAKSEMMELMKEPEAMKAFDALPDN